MLQDIQAAFCALPPQGKAAFLARVIHSTTIDARATAYVAGTSDADGAKLREFNEFVHRVSGCISQVLDGSADDDWDASVLVMIFAFCGGGREARERELAGWLGLNR